MKKQILITGLMIATISLTSCGRKAPQVDKDVAPPTKLALKAGDTCDSSATDSAKLGKLSADKFLAKPVKDYAQTTNKPAVVDYAKKLYASSVQAPSKIESLIVREVKIKGAKKTVAKTFLVSINEKKAQEKFEIIIEETVGKDSKKALKAFSSAFMKDTCVDVKELPTTPPASEQSEEETKSTNGSESEEKVQGADESGSEKEAQETNSPGGEEDFAF